jgi:hypothetical protein
VYLCLDWAGVPRAVAHSTGAALADLLQAAARLAGVARVPANQAHVSAHARWSVHDVQVFYDKLKQLGEHTAAYVRTVYQAIVLTVPNAVTHC